MGISTKIAKAIAKNPDLTRPGNTATGCTFAVADAHPTYAVVYEDRGPDLPRLIVTVVFRTTETYVRQGTTYTLAREETA